MLKNTQRRVEGQGGDAASRELPAGPVEVHPKEVDAVVII